MILRTFTDGDLEVEPIAGTERARWRIARSTKTELKHAIGWQEARQSRIGFIAKNIVNSVQFARAMRE